MDIQENLQNKIKNIIERYKEEINTLRTNRASVSLVDNLKVDYFGVKTPISQVASISLSDPRTIVIAPWNVDNLVDIEKAINESDLNLNPNNDGKVVRLSLPSLTEERRKELAKILGKKTENSRIQIRQVREEIISQVERMEKKGEISEDDKFLLKEKIQKEIEKGNKDIEEISEKKEQAIMEV